MIAVLNLSKIYGKKQNSFAALQDVSFEVPDGKTVAIIGKSGSGKSTLMHILGGLDHPTDGEVNINGVVLTELKRKAMDRFRAEDLGFVFQSFFVEANQTCYQNVALPLEINEVPFRKRRKLVQRALEQVELSDKIDQKAGNLSGGQKQRLAIARAIVNQPGLILADEPTGNLDSTTGEKIIHLLFRLHRELGSSLVIVTHDEELADRCDIRVTLRDGKVVDISDMSAGSAGNAKNTSPFTGPQMTRSQAAKPADSPQAAAPLQSTSPLLAKRRPQLATSKPLASKHVVKHVAIQTEGEED